MPAAFQIIGWSSSDKVPGVGGETVYGSGPINPATIPLSCLIVGTKLSTGSMTPNQDVLQALSADDVDLKVGAGGEAAIMAYAALARGVPVFLAPVAEAGGAAAATLTIALTGTVAAGTWAIRLHGKLYTGAFSISDTITTIHAAIAAAINADVRCPFTATSSAASAVATVKSKGARGNYHAGVIAPSQSLPAGMTMTLTGGTPLTGGVTPFTGGTGTETNTTLLGVLFPTEYSRIALAENDAVNLAAWRAQVDAQAGPTSNITQHIVVATTGTLTAAQSLSQTTLNHPRFNPLWYLNSETHPAVIAADFAARRVAVEQGDPDASYDDEILTAVAPQAFKQDWPSYATKVAALNAGVTPIYTTADGYAKIVRAIVSRCLNGTTPDYRVLDTGDAYVPDYIRRAASINWQTSFRVANIRNAADPADTSRPLPSGVGTPSVWNSSVEQMLRKFERGEGFPAPIITDVDNNKPSSSYDDAGKRIMSAIPAKVMPNTHQIGISVRQIAA